MEDFALGNGLKREKGVIDGEGAMCVREGITANGVGTLAVHPQHFKQALIPKFFCEYLTANSSSKSALKPCFRDEGVGWAKRLCLPFSPPFCLL